MDENGISIDGALSQPTTFNASAVSTAPAPVPVTDGKAVPPPYDKTA